MTLEKSLISLVNAKYNVLHGLRAYHFPSRIPISQLSEMFGQCVLVYVLFEDSIESSMQSDAMIPDKSTSIDHPF
jgi:hypothetical protein